MSEDVPHDDPRQTPVDGQGIQEPASQTMEGVPALPVREEPQAVTAYSSKQLKRVRDLLTRLYAVRRTARFYPMDHPATVEAVSALKDVVDRYHQEGVDVQLAFFEGELIFGDRLLAEESLLFEQLVRDMTAIGVGSLVVGRGVDLNEFSRAIAVLAADSFEVARNGGIMRMIAEANVPHIEVGTVKVFEREDVGELSPEEARETYDNALELMREIDLLINRNKSVNAGQVKTVVRSLVDNVLSNRYAMLELTGLKDYDEYTFYHSANVAILSLALGSAVTNDYRFLSSLGVGALLHDIGKMTVSLDILNKPGALTAEEWALVRQHPVYGAQQAALVPGLDKSAVVTILEHHMRFDGSGYPNRTPRRPQHLASRIVAVADAFDAMTSRRSYSAARVQDEAMTLLVQSAGTALDPALTRLFVSIMGVYPPRTVVRLEDGRTGIVIRPSESDLTRPLVRVIAQADGEMIDPFSVDLSAEGQPGIAMCLDAADLNIEVDDYI